MRMKNKQNVAWSTFRYFVLAFLLCLSVVPLRGQPDAAVLSSPSADSLIIFSYPSRIRMFQDGICGQPTVVAEVEETAAHLS